MTSYVSEICFLVTLPNSRHLCVVRSAFCTPQVGGASSASRSCRQLQLTELRAVTEHHRTAGSGIHRDKALGHFALETSLDTPCWAQWPQNAPASRMVMPSKLQKVGLQRVSREPSRNPSGTSRWAPHSQDSFPFTTH